MRPAVLALFFAILVAGAQQPNNPNIISTPALSPAEELKQFTVPPGFEVQLVASEPEIDKPMNICFDDRGRLWVTCSTEYPFAAKGDRGKDRLVILEDFAPDGKARKVTSFASDLNIPIGVLPLSGTREPEGLVFSIPGIWRVNGKADERKIVYKDYGFKDTHGMTNSFVVGFDGWIYACHGFSNTSKVQGTAPPALTMQSGNTYRFKADGSRIESYTRGQVNPFGLTFDPRGDLYSADCHSRPIYQLIRGAHYPSFGKPHDGLGFAPEMCKHDHGSTGICGVVYYDADHFPVEYRDTVFIGNVVTNRINFDRIVYQGSSPVAQARPDFLTCKDAWFRPVDIKLGPDGALYVADFYNCVIGHYEVPLDHPKRDRQRGRIWRIVWKGEGSKPPVDPRPGADVAASVDLVKDLAHANLAVRMRATNLLAGRRNDAATGRLQEWVLDETDRGDVWGAGHAVWVLERRGELTAELLGKAVAHRGEAVRLHTGRVLAEREKLDDAGRKHVLALLTDRSPFVSRNAADAAGRHPDVSLIRPLLKLRGEVPAIDSHQVHTVRIALRNQFLEGGAFDKLEGISKADEDAIADVSLGVPNAGAAAFLMKWLPQRKLDGEPLANTVRHIARYGSIEVVGRLVEWARGDRATDRLRQVAMFKAVEKGVQERGDRMPEGARAWAIELVPALLVARDPREVQAAGEIIASQRLTESEPALHKLVTDGATADGPRLAALNALATLDAGKNVALVGKVLADGQRAIEFRERVGEILVRINTPAARELLAANLASSPARLQTSLASGLAGSKDGVEVLLKAVESGKASARLLRERAVEVKLKQTNLTGWEPRAAKLTTGLPPADQRIAELMVARGKGFASSKGDIEAGKAVYAKHCANCHQIGGQGQKIGPQLDGLGVRGLERILEDTIDPNRNIDAAFRTTILNLKSGQVVTGLVLREEGEVVVLADALGKEVRVPKAGIEERTIASLSPMPANLIDQIPESEYYHLLAYLLAQRPRE